MKASLLYDVDPVTLALMRSHDAVEAADEARMRYEQAQNPVVRWVAGKICDYRDRAVDAGYAAVESAHQAELRLIPEQAASSEDLQ